MKILHVVASVQAVSGGPAVSVTRLAAEQAKMGHEVTLASLKETHLGESVPAPGVRMVGVPSDFCSKRGRGWSPSFRRLVEAEASGADVMHNHGLWMWPNAYARLAARKAGRPLVISPRGMLDTWSLRRSRIKKAVAWRLFERKNLNAAALFHATSATEVANVRAMNLEQPVVLAPNGVDLPDLSARPGRELLETEFPQLRGKRWVAFLSRLHPKKGIDVLLEAWGQLRREAAAGGVAGGMDDAILVVAGPDLVGYRRNVEQIVRTAGLDTSVVLTGELRGSRKDSLFAHAGVFVLPSYSENFGIAIAEALAWGCPVIASTATPWRDVVEHGAGWWVDPECRALVGALRTALSASTEDLKAMGRSGRSLVAERYSWNAAADKITEAYAELLV